MPTTMYKTALAVMAWYTMLPSLVSSASDRPPRITVGQLRAAIESRRPGPYLHRLLHDSRGVLRVAAGDNDGRGGVGGLAALRTRALGGLCDCPTFRPPGDAFGEALQKHPKDLQEIALPDGAVRRTLASATVVHGKHEDAGGWSEPHLAAALELPGWVRDSCGGDAYGSFEDLRDAVADVVDLFVERLDQESDMSKDRSYRHILSSADHLEHFHIYTKSSASPTEGTGGEGNSLNEEGIEGNEEGNESRALWEMETPTLDFHTDAGFFLSFVPAMDCGAYATDASSFYLEGHDEPITFEDDEVVIMLGAGAQHWLPPLEEGGDVSSDPRQQYPFLAASHALRLSPETHRAWYGKMHLLPASYTATNVDPRSPASVQFGEMLPSFQMKDYVAHVPTSQVDGCGTSVFTKDSLRTQSLETNVQEPRGRRRLQHVNSPSSCNNITNFFCWYQCIDIPESDQAEQYVQEGYSLYCLDPGKLASSDDPIADATAPCYNGYVHNSNCIGSWQETDENIPGYKLPYEVQEDEGDVSSVFTPDIYDGEKYCYGGTSMYMDGFQWQGTTCVIYLFESWVLSTPGKFAAASIGSLIFGVLLEFVLWKRRSVYSLAPGVRRLCLSALVYGTQLSMGYFIMLVIMTYSGPLFICTVGGMMLGHVFFNAQDALVKSRMEKSTEAENSQTPACCAEETGHTVSGSNTELNSYQNEGSELENGNCTEKTELKGAMADGVTPCCQYTL